MEHCGSGHKCCACISTVVNVDVDDQHGNENETSDSRNGSAFTCFAIYSERCLKLKRAIKRASPFARLFALLNFAIMLNRILSTEQTAHSGGRQDDTIIGFVHRHFSTHRFLPCFAVYLFSWTVSCRSRPVKLPDACFQFRSLRHEEALRE